MQRRKTLKIGAVSYLNSKPLVCGLEPITDRLALVFDLPSRLADDLSDGRLDVALVPSIEYFMHSDYVIASDACIACRGPVLSVKLISRVPMAEIRSLALDEGSRTSAALTQILLAEQCSVIPDLSPFPIGASLSRVSTDAVLLIGDRAIRPQCDDFAYEWDLGDLWCQWTGLPFVFAMWTATSAQVAAEVEIALSSARDAGLANLSALASSESQAYGLSSAACERYLRENLYFFLGERELQGLDRFRQCAIQLGLLPPDCRSCPTEQTLRRPSASASRESHPSSSVTRGRRSSTPLRRPCSIQEILDKTVRGDRLQPAEGVQLLRCDDLRALGRAADQVTHRLHPERYRTYNIDRNINYTNVCTAVCDFCAFYRPPGHEEAYVLPRDVLLQKVQETVERGGEQILIQGGLHPKFKLEWYEQMLRDIKSEFPRVNIHGFSPPEIYHFTKVNRLTLETVLTRLRDAGLGSIPGGGAEILVDRVRRQITRGKVLTDDWLHVMRVWHELGGRSSATMMFGHVETLDERIEHLERLRQLQDETAGFTAFICWTFQPENTAMSDLQHASAFEYLKTQAVARLYLDNFKNIQSSWVTQGLKIGQLGMVFANDMGSLMMEENVVAQAGTVHYLTLQQIRAAIEELGYVPRQRNVFYELVDPRHEAFAIRAADE